MKKLNTCALVVVLLSVITAVATNSFMISAVAAIVISIALSFLAFGVILKSPPLLEGIPVIPNNSIFGYSKYLVGKGNSHNIMLEHAERYARDPGCCQFEFMGNRYVCVFDSALAKAVLRDVFGKGFLHHRLTPGTPLNTFSLDTNDEWKKRRNLFRHAFSATVLKQFENMVEEIVDHMISQLDVAADAGDVVELDNVFQKLAMDVICEVAFQYKLEGKFEKANEKISRSFELVQQLATSPKILLRLPAWMLGNSLLGENKQINNFMNELATDIFDNICNLEENNLLKENSLAKAIYQFSQLPEITNDEVKSEIRLMFIAGFETTAHTLSFFFYSIAANPTVQLACQDAIDYWIMQNPKNSNTIMPAYVEAVLKESMRKYPTAANGSTRLIREESYPLRKIVDVHDGEVEVFHIPKGNWLLVDIFSVQNCTKNWEKPLEFLPSRFLTKENEDNFTEVGDDGMESKRERNPLSAVSAYAGIGLHSNELSFCPFSYGPRNCLGMHLSLLELRTTIMKMCSRYSFELADKNMLDDTFMAETFLTMRPKNKLPMLLSRRD